MGSDIDLFRSFSMTDYINVYKVYFVGFIDTLSSYANYQNVFIGTEKKDSPYLVRDFSYSQWRLKDSTSPPLYEEGKARAFILVNEYLNGQKKIPFVIEVKGQMFKKY